jgi:hypothetical protein
MAEAADEVVERGVADHVPRSERFHRESDGDEASDPPGTIHS